MRLIDRELSQFNSLCHSNSDGIDHVVTQLALSPDRGHLVLAVDGCSVLTMNAVSEDFLPKRPFKFGVCVGSLATVAKSDDASSVGAKIAIGRLEFSMEGGAARRRSVPLQPLGRVTLSSQDIKDGLQSRFYLIDRQVRAAVAAAGTNADRSERERKLNTVQKNVFIALSDK